MADWYSPAVMMYHAQQKTLEEVGQEFGVTRERVRQVLKLMGFPARSHLQAGFLVRTKPDAYCEVCSSPFHRNNSTQRTCSPKCGGLARRKIKNQWVYDAVDLVMTGMTYRDAIDSLDTPDIPITMKTWRILNALHRVPGLLEKRPSFIRMMCRTCGNYFNQDRSVFKPISNGAVRFLCPLCSQG